jgi:hypothetical protein
MAEKAHVMSGRQESPSRSHIHAPGDRPIDPAGSTGLTSAQDSTRQGEAAKVYGSARVGVDGRSGVVGVGPGGAFLPEPAIPVHSEGVC